MLVGGGWRIAGMVAAPAAAGSSCDANVVIGRHGAVGFSRGTVPRPQPIPSQGELSGIVLLMVDMSALNAYDLAVRTLRLSGRRRLIPIEIPIAEHEVGDACASVTVIHANFEEDYDCRRRLDADHRLDVQRPDWLFGNARP